MSPVRPPIASANPDLRAFAVADPTAEQWHEVEMLRQALAERHIEKDGIGVFVLPTGDGSTTVITRTPEEFAVGARSGGVYELTRVESALPSATVPGVPGGIRAASAGLMTTAALY